MMAASPSGLDIVTGVTCASRKLTQPLERSSGAALGQSDIPPPALVRRDELTGHPAYLAPMIGVFAKDGSNRGTMT